MWRSKDSSLHVIGGRLHVVKATVNQVIVRAMNVSAEELEHTQTTQNISGQLFVSRLMMGVDARVRVSPHLNATSHVTE